jgi:cell division protein FtsI (penicillin-binding protein 3)
LFIGLTPAQKPALAIAVIIEEPKGAIYGGVVAAPIFREIAAQSLPFLGYYPQGENTPVLAGLLPTPASAQTPPQAKPAPKALASQKPLQLQGAAPKKPLKVMPDLSGLTIRQALNLLHRSGRAVLKGRPGRRAGPGASITRQHLQSGSVPS